MKAFISRPWQILLPQNTIGTTDGPGDLSPRLRRLARRGVVPLEKDLEVPVVQPATGRIAVVVAVVDKTLRHSLFIRRIQNPLKGRIMGNGYVDCDGHVMERVDEIVEESAK
jgi:hypothetical protein